MSCRNWQEVENNAGITVEWCKAKRRSVGCCSSLATCPYPDYYNVKEEMWELVKKLEDRED